MLRRSLKWLVLAAAVALFGGCAAMDQDARINFLEGQMKDVLEKSAEWGVTSKDFRFKMADYTAQLDSLHSQIQSLNGRLEEMESGATPREHPIFSQQGVIDEIYSLKERVAFLESKVAELQAGLLTGEGAPPQVTAPQPVVSAPSKPPAVVSEKALYDEAMASLKKKQYDKAIRGFRKFIKKYPRHDLADNAQYWIGEAYYAQRKYEESIIEFEEVIQQYPKGDKVPAALLKEGLAFHRLKDDSPARQILNKLIENYPNSEEAGIAKRSLQEIK
jgi:tol-pal system protein YbgF